MKSRPGPAAILKLGAAICLFLFLSTAALAERRSLMSSHVPDVVTSGAAPMVGHLPAAQRLSLAISLPVKNQAQLDEFLQELYDPHSASFHQYLSVAEFAERFGPTEADYSKLLAFAASNGLTVIDRPANRMVLDVDAPAENIEKAFHVSMGIFQHPTEARTFYSPDREPTIDLDVPVLHISGLDDYDLPRAKNVQPGQVSSNTTGSGPGGSFLGSDLRAAYYGGSLNGAGQKVAVFAFKGFNITDIDTYFSNAGQTLNVPVVGVSVNGASLSCPTATCDDTEQSLDIEQTISMAPGLNEVLVYVGKSNVSIFNQMAADNTAKSASCSYGWADNENSLDPIFEEMAAQGQSVFVATGDQGSSTAANVVWPSDDPWVTAVGGTVLTTNGPGGSWKSETGWSKSAGMPSPNGVPIPSYQLLAGVITSSNHASSTLRNIPDVASESNASQYVCSDGTCRNHGGGTSYAAPLWASYIALINEQAATNGEPNVGLINSAIYGIGVGSSFTTDFHDITSGSNGQYSAVSGYDLVTGWGSMNGANLINALAPPPKR